MIEIKFYRVVDRESEDWSKSNNGGDYEEGRTVAVRDGIPFAGHILTMIAGWQQTAGILLAGKLARFWKAGITN